MDWDHWRIPMTAIGTILDEYSYLSISNTFISNFSHINGTTTAIPPAPFYKDYTSSRFMIGIWELILCIIGTPVNALVIYLARLIINKINNQENQQLCIFSMACADFLFTSIHCPMMSANFAFSIDYNPIPCKFLYFITHLATVASSLSLLCLNVDKFVSLRFPLRYYTILTYKRTKLGILICWLIALAWASFFVFGPYTEFNDRCEVYTTVAYGYLLFVTLFFVLPTVFSLAISIYAIIVATRAKKTEYQRISNRMPLEELPNENDHDLTTPKNDLQAESSRSRNISGSTTPTNGLTASPSSAARRKSKFKTVTFVFSTTVWSSITFIPYRIAYLIYHFCDNEHMVRAFFFLFAVMVSNATGNSFITIATQYQYRLRVKRLFSPVKHILNSGIGTMHQSAHSLSEVSSESPPSGKERKNEINGNNLKVPETNGKAGNRV